MVAVPLYGVCGTVVVGADVVDGAAVDVPEPVVVVGAPTVVEGAAAVVVGAVEILTVEVVAIALTVVVVAAVVVVADGGVGVMTMPAMVIVPAFAKSVPPAGRPLGGVHGCGIGLARSYGVTAGDVPAMLSMEPEVATAVVPKVAVSLMFPLTLPVGTTKVNLVSSTTVTVAIAPDPILAPVVLRNPEPYTVTVAPTGADSGQKLEM